MVAHTGTETENLGHLMTDWLTDLRTAEVTEPAVLVTLTAGSKCCRQTE